MARQLSDDLIETSRLVMANRLAWILWGTVVLAVSPLPASLLGIGGNLIFLFGCVIFLAVFLGSGRRYPMAPTPWVIVPIALTMPAVVYWRDPGLALFPIYFFMALLVFLAVDRVTIHRFASLASTSLIFIVVGAWVGFMYAFAGGASLFSISNPDLRINEFYLTTFSNWSIGNLIRPAGLFDEPGTLSFMICFVAALRSRLGLSRRTTWLLLGLGLVTTSVAHIIYMLCHAVADRRHLLRHRIYLLIAALATVAAATAFDRPDSDASAVFLSRFVLEDGKLGGDSRSDLLASALNKIDSEIFFFGLDSDCVLRPAVCESKGYGQFGETPAGMLLLLGLFLAAPYFTVLACLLYRAIQRFDFIYFGIFLLLLQRPYVSTFGYALLILLVGFRSPLMLQSRHVNARANLALNSLRR